MGKKGHSEEEILRVLREAESGDTVVEIQRRISGISQRMLTLTLKRLEADGIVKRTLFPSVPPRVDYELTELGQTLRAALVPLHLWAARNKQTVAENRANSAG